MNLGEHVTCCSIRYLDMHPCDSASDPITSHDRRRREVRADWAELRRQPLSLVGIVHYASIFISNNCTFHRPFSKELCLIVANVWWSQGMPIEYNLHLSNRFGDAG